MQGKQRQKQHKAQRARKRRAPGERLVNAGKNRGMNSARHRRREKEGPRVREWSQQEKTEAKIAQGTEGE